MKNTKSIDRLNQYLEIKGIRPTAFEKAVGLSNGYIGTQCKRNGDLGEGILRKIVDYCRDLRPEWLLTGEGEMLRSVQSTLADNNIDDMSLIVVEFRRQVGEYKEEVQLLNKEIGTLREEIGGLKAENRILKEELVKLKSVVPSPPQNPSPAIDVAAVRCVDAELSDRI